MRWIEEHIELLFAAVVVAVLAVAIGGGIYVSTRTSTEGPCTVQSKDRAGKSDGSSSMRVYTDCGVFSVEDSILSGRFSSADAYAALEPGQTYRFDTRGMRIPFLSQFPNIITATEVQA